MSKKETTAVAKVDETNNALAMPFELDVADAGLGRDDISARDVAMPFIAVLQSGSPQLKPGNDKFIKGASMGMFLNTATRKVYSGEEGINVVPVLYRRAVVEWADRDSGGGWKGTHPQEYLDDMRAAGKTYVDEKNRTRLMKGSNRNSSDTCLIETGYFFIMVLDDQGNVIDHAMLSMSSTQWKAARSWNTLISGMKVKAADGSLVPAPIMSQVYKLTTGLQRNPSGEWYGITVSHVGTVPSKEVYDQAKKFRKFGESANITPVQDIDDSDTPAPAGKDVGDDEIPF